MPWMIGGVKSQNNYYVYNIIDITYNIYSGGVGLSSLSQFLLSANYYCWSGHGRSRRVVSIHFVSDGMDGGAALSVAKVIGFDASCSGEAVPGNWQWARMNE